MWVVNHREEPVVIVIITPGMSAPHAKPHKWWWVLFQFIGLLGPVRLRGLYPKRAGWPGLLYLGPLQAPVV